MKTKKKSLAAVMCVLLAILTVFAMMPNLSYADSKTAKNTTLLKRSSSSWDVYSAIMDAFGKYKQARNSIKGDILIKGAGDSSYDTENDHGYAVKDGESYTLGLKLDVTGVKKRFRGCKI